VVPLWIGRLSWTAVAVLRASLKAADGFAARLRQPLHVVLETPPLFVPFQNLAQHQTSMLMVQLLAASDPPRRLESLNGTCLDGRENEYRQRV
jgi:hypothetical protein